MSLWSLNLSETFAPTLSAPEILAHGALIYLGLCVMLRLIPRREPRKPAVSDVLFVVIIAEIASNAFSRGAKSLTDFVLVLLTVTLLGYAVDWLAFRSRRLGAPIKDHKSPTPRVILRRDTAPVDEPVMKRRHQAVEDAARVRRAYLGSDRGISVAERRDADGPPALATKPREAHRAAHDDGGDEEAARRRRRRLAEELLARASVAAER